jgi:tRNA threonylcarbamoyladenosine biosynthesis protein TsaB
LLQQIFELKNMALILNIETSTEVCSVALAKDGEAIYLKESTEGMNHSRLLTLFIEQLFAENRLDIKSLDAVAVSKGPGSYTGLRIGVSVAKGLCYGLEIPLISVGSLKTLGVYTATNYSQFTNIPAAANPLFCPMIDARRMEVYTSLYDLAGNELKQVSAEIVTSDFLAALLDKQPVLFFGNGAAKCAEVLQHKNAVFAGPSATSASFMMQLSERKFEEKQFEDVAYFEPFYLKNFVATIPKNKILG